MNLIIEKPFLIFLVDKNMDSNIFDEISKQKNVNIEKLANKVNNAVYFTSDALLNMLNDKKISKSTKEYLYDIATNPKKVCNDGCGTHSNMFLIDYRDNGGCISKEMSCPVCVCLKNKYRNEMGVAAANGDINKILELYNF